MENPEVYTNAANTILNDSKNIDTEMDTELNSKVGFNQMSSKIEINEELVENTMPESPQVNLCTDYIKYEQADSSDSLNCKKSLESFKDKKSLMEHLEEHPNFRNDSKNIDAKMNTELNSNVDFNQMNIKIEINEELVENTTPESPQVNLYTDYIKYEQADSSDFLNCKKCLERFKDKKSLMEHLVELPECKPFNINKTDNGSQDKNCMTMYEVHVLLKPKESKDIERQPNKTIDTSCGNLIKMNPTETISTNHLNSLEENVIKKQFNSDDKLFHCDQCKKSFRMVDNLIKHKLEHFAKKSYLCNICNKSFNDNGKLKRHERTHTGEKPYSCDLCDRSFSEKGTLDRHRRTHTGEKPFSCDVCNKSFIQKNTFVLHKRTHTGEKHYHCNICNKSFNERSTLVKHTRIHTGEKPYSCDVCDKSFSVSGNLVTHKRTHNGSRPYSCYICNKSFTQKHRLMSHTQTHIRMF